MSIKLERIVTQNGVAFKKDPACQGCDLYTKGYSFTQPDGYANGAMPSPSRLLIVGESIGSTEASAGLPLRPTGQAGSVFELMLKMAGIDRNSITIWSMIGCQPPKGLLSGMDYEQSAVNHCATHFQRVVNATQPRAILAFGDVAYRHLTQQDPKLNPLITKGRGYTYPLKSFAHSHSIAGNKNIPIIPTMHPSFMRRTGMTTITTAVHDLRLAYAIATQRWKEGKDYILDPLVSDYGKIPTSTSTSPNLSAYTVSAPYYFYPHLDEARSIINYLTKLAESNPTWFEENFLCYDIETAASVLAETEEVYGADIHPITQFQFSFTAGQGVVFPFEGEYINLIRQLMKLSGKKIAWNNYRFDDPHLFEAGIEIEGTRHDGMVMFHHSEPDQPNGLQYAASLYGMPFAWKHLVNADYSFYGAADVDSLARIVNPSPDNGINPIATRRPLSLPQQMKREGIWDGYAKLTQPYQMVIEVMQRNGHYIDAEKRERLSETLQAEQEIIDAKLTAMMPDHRILMPKGGWGLKSIPKKLLDTILPEDTTPEQAARRVQVKEYFKTWAKEVNAYVAEPTSKTDAKISSFVDDLKSHLSSALPYISYDLPEDDYQAASQKLNEALDFINTFELQWNALEGDPDRSLRLFYTEGMNLNSTQQIQSLLQAHDIAIPMANGKKTLGKTELRKLIKKLKDERLRTFLLEMLTYKEMGKVNSTYIKGWKINPRTGCVHTTFTFKGATGQLTSVSPNVQNIPKHTALGKAIRSCIIAKPDCLIIEADYSSFHARTLALEAGDPDYLRLASLDIHSYLAARLLQGKLPQERTNLVSSSLTDAARERLKEIDLHLEILSSFSSWLKLPDNELKERLDWVKANYKPVRDKQAKPTILGYGFGLGHTKLYAMNEDSFKDEAEAKQVIIELNRLFPITAAFRNSIRQRAAKQTKLISRYGFVRRMHAVEEFNPATGGMKSGQDSEAAIAFLPANDAFGTIRLAHLRMHELGLTHRYGAFSTIHDSLLFNCPKQHYTEALATIYLIMTRPARALAHPVICPEGLVCDVEISAGPSMGELPAIPQATINEAIEQLKQNNPRVYETIITL